MPVFNFGAGIQSNPLDAYNEIATLRKQSKIAQLFGDAYKAPEQRSSILEQIARIDPASASLAEQQFQKRDALDRENLTRDARLTSGLYRNANNAQAQTMYSSLRDRASRVLGGAQLPQELDQGTASLLSALGSGGGATNPYDGLPSDIQSLQLLQDNPQLLALDKERRQAAGMVPKLAQTDQGYGWATPGSGIQLAPITGVAGGRQPAEAPQLFAALSQKYGIQPTSVQRTPQHNREVGGVSNSYHLSGQAADYVVPPQAKAQFIQDAQANGYEAIDEGDHIHIEPAGKRGGPQRIAQPYRAPERNAPPDGYRMTADGNLEAIPGGPADPNMVKPMTAQQRQKLDQTMRKDRQMLGTMESNIDNTVKMIDGVLAEKSNFGGVTGMGAMGSRIPGTRWADIAAKLDTLKARSAFGALQEMRANSPTGGALGSVSERELYLLQNAETQLQNSQSPEALANALREYKRVLLESKRRMREGVSEFYQDAGAASNSQTPQQPSGGVDDLLSKYGVK